MKTLSENSKQLNLNAGNKMSRRITRIKVNVKGLEEIDFNQKIITNECNKIEQFDTLSKGLLTVVVCHCRDQEGGVHL